MADAAEVAIESALLNRYNAFQFGSPDILYRAQPNVLLSPPTAKPGVYWLRATFLPADSFALGINRNSSNQHYGIFQIDVFWYKNDGELAPGRLATDLIAWFKRDTQLTKDGFTVVTSIGNKIASRGRMISSDPWVMIPVSVPYRAFAANPA